MAKAICGAKTRSGGKCQKPPISGRNRCKLHGGKTPRGIASPHAKHLRYSKALAGNASLADAYRLALADEELESVRHEIALVDALVSEVLVKIAGKLTPEEASAANTRLLSLIEQRRRLVETERKTLELGQQFITVEQAMALIAAISAVIREVVHDRAALSHIQTRLDTLVVTGALAEPSTERDD